MRGVVFREVSVSGDVVSEGEVAFRLMRGEVVASESRRGEYGGGGETTGSMLGLKGHLEEDLEPPTIRPDRPRCKRNDPLMLRRLNGGLGRCIIHGAPLLGIVLR